MGIELVCLDFDGTLTDIHHDPKEAEEGWKRDIANALGISYKELSDRWEGVVERMCEKPESYGWSIGGKIVAPGTSDPMIVYTVISQILFTQDAKYLDLEEREPVLYEIFKRNQIKLPNPFKEETYETLQKLQEKFDLCIVTNSSTDLVSRRLRELLGEDHGIPIYGEARKYVLHHDWNKVPEKIEKPGYGRSIYLRRREYSELINRLVDERGLSNSQVVVIGDIYELDLAIPEHHEMGIILAANHATSQPEILATSSYKRGVVERDLGKIGEHLRTI